ncbi:hypothetical protein [Granulicella sp. L46]|uniref:hypothetical protein n=1 Tax=Granulicella sp. L46 TaxID=1641865 RepID=UPI00131AFFC1|nr:hypothetical protein [Granulicella sp. L46]
MTPQSWESPETFHAPGGAAVYGGSAQAAAYALRPLSLGELLDRTFSVYRSRFWLFAGIGAISALLQTVISAAQLAPMHLAKMAGAFDGARTRTAIPATPFPPNYLTGIGMGMALAILGVSLLYLLVFVVTQAATVFALSEVYLGKATTIGESLRATIGRWYRYLGIGIWQAGSMMWIPGIALIAGAILLATKIPGLKILGGVLIFLGIAGGVPVGVILWLRNSLGVQATVIEGLTVRASMARSKVLTAGAKGRVFVLLLLAGALNYAASLLQMPLMLFVMFTIARGGKAVATEIVMLLVGFVGHALVQPVLMIGLSLLYFDQRVRKEAFDLVMLLGPESSPVAAAGMWAPAQTMPMSMPPASIEAIAAGPISGAPMDETSSPRTGDETLP